MRHSRIFVLDFDGYVIRSKNRSGHSHDHCQLCRIEPMIQVFGYPNLKNARSCRTDGASAIDEILVDFSDFSDVKVGWHEALIGQHEVDGRGGIGDQSIEERADGHVLHLERLVFLKSHFTDDPSARAKRLRFDPRLMQHAHKQIGQEGILLAIEGYMAGMLVTAADE